jgi:hypothetical protein
VKDGRRVLPGLSVSKADPALTREIGSTRR